MSREGNNLQVGDHERGEGEAAATCLNSTHASLDLDLDGNATGRRMGPGRGSPFRQNFCGETVAPSCVKTQK